MEEAATVAASTTLKKEEEVAKAAGAGIAKQHVKICHHYKIVKVRPHLIRRNRARDGLPLLGLGGGAQDSGSGRQKGHPHDQARCYDLGRDSSGGLRQAPPCAAQVASKVTFGAVNPPSSPIPPLCCVHP